MTLSPKPLAYDKPIDPTEMPQISACTEMTTEDTNVPTQDDKYPWLDPDDKQRHIIDAETLTMKLNLADCALDEKGKEDFLAKTDNFHDVFSLRDEIGTCPFIEVHLKLKDKTPFLYNHVLCEYHRSERCIPYSMTSIFMSKLTILWVTYISLPSNGYGYEC